MNVKGLQGKPLFIYLSVIENIISAILVQENGKHQKPIYFVSKILHGLKLKYQRLEKLTLTLLTGTRKLRPYFQSHHIIVRTSQLIRQVLAKSSSREE